MRKLDVIDTKYLLLEIADQRLDAAKQEAKRTEVLALIAANPQKKVQEKCDGLFDWMQKGGKLNNVIDRTIHVLIRDGYLSFGKNGNLQHDLLLNKYSPGTASSQASQMHEMLPMLKIVREENGRFVPSPDSLVLITLNEKLGLTPSLSQQLVEVGDKLAERESFEIVELPASRTFSAEMESSAPILRKVERHSLITAGVQIALEDETRSLNTSEREAVVKVRFGQGDFRNALLKEGGERCWMTGIEGKRLLVASHIKPWSHCQNDTDARGCQDNGLLLSALWDAAFDSGLISFESDWSVVVCSELSESAKTALGLMERMTLPEKYRTDTRKMYLAYHRAKVFEFWKNIEPIVGNSA